MSKVSGTLYVIATPIGNLEDITYRSIKTLSSVDYVLSEDTRVTKKILDKYNIENQLISFNEKNEVNKIDKIILDLKESKEIALVSDAGTPCISDPGFRLISRIKDNNLSVSVIPIPGASAAITALSVSGLPSDSFYFVGFLPKKKGRAKKIKELSIMKSSLIIYESPYRVEKTLLNLYNELGNRRVFIGREMTKMFEEYIYSDLKSITTSDKTLKTKGEYVIVVAKEGFKDE